MSQKYIKSKNNNPKSPAYGKYYAQAVYDENFIETEEIALFIQQQATLKKSDIIATLTELGEAIKHFLEMGQKVRLEGVGIFKVGFSSIGVANPVDCTASTITTRRILFSPETERVVVGQTRAQDGSIKQKYVVSKVLIKDVVFEETHPNAMTTKPSDGSSSDTGSGTGTNTGSGSGSNTGGSTPGGNTGGGGDGDDDLNI